MHIASIGIDLGRTDFHLVALGEHSKVVVRKKFSRKQLLAYTANLPASLIGLEACSVCVPRLQQWLRQEVVRKTLYQVQQERLPAEAIAEAVARRLNFVPSISSCSQAADHTLSPTIAIF